MDMLTILAALGPLAVDLGKSLIGRFIQQDVYKPVNVDEYVRMRQLDLDMFKATNAAGQRVNVIVCCGLVLKGCTVRAQ
jgi:hypothetical protein